MLPSPEYNWLAIVVADVALFVLGGLWYSPLIAGKPWMKAMGWDKLSEAEMRAKQKEAPPGYVAMVIGGFVTALVIATIVSWAGATEWMDGLIIGLVVWVGLHAAPALAGVFFESRPWSLYVINAGYYLVGFVAIGIILSVWP